VSNSCGLAVVKSNKDPSAFSNEVSINVCANIRMKCQSKGNKQLKGQVY
jgi:hypothetical protein